MNCNMATEMELMTVDKPEDPDAQATITDFLDYTEYLPSDLNRSLTLIGKLDESYLSKAGTVHELTKQYGIFPKLSRSDRPTLDFLRTQISYNLDYAISARESALGEATRLYEMVDRHYNRLASIKSKLKALPKPPSRDPTPVPRSPQATRKSPPPRITLRLDGARPSTSIGRAPERAQKSRHRNRRITIPGEVLPPPNPDSPTSFTASDWESIPPSPLPMPTSRVGGSRKPIKPVRIRPPKPPKQPKDRVPRQPRGPGMGTNVHSAVAGISTSNALSLLPAPPPDAKPGSEHAPWMRLTEWEMAKLRKRMKKNAIWTPSETMIRRELAEAGRGPDNYRLKKAESEACGEEFTDVDEIATTAPGKPLAPGEISADSLGLAETNLSNRGMKLNEAKKLKREAMKEASYKEAEEVAKRLGDIGSSFKELFSKKAEAPADSTSATTSFPNGNQFQTERSSKKDRSAQKEKAKESVRTHGEKRKRDETPKSKVADIASETVTSPSKPANKKQKTSKVQPVNSTITTKTVTTTVPLAAPAPSSSKAPLRRSKSVTPMTPATPSMAAPEKPKISTAPSKPTATSSRPRRISLTLKGPANPSPQTAQPSPLGSSRAASRRGSTGPPSATVSREDLRRKSATPAPPVSPAAVFTAASRRSKRPVPGAVVENEGGAAISVGKRQHAPPRLLLRPSVKKASDDAGGEDRGAVVKAEEMAAGEEDIDPDEPRYCYCGDVSYGEMVACENDNVSEYIPRQSALMMMIRC